MTAERVFDEIASGRFGRTAAAQVNSVADHSPAISSLALL
jgi:hypothetical protein